MSFLLGFLNTAVAWFFKAILVKFFIFTALFLVTTGFTQYLVGKLLVVNPGELNSMLSGLSSGTWYFMNLTMMHIGLPMVISAAITRFTIRRLPVIG